MNGIPKQLAQASAEGGTLPLSAAQAEVWLAQKLAPADSRFNIAGFVEISGSVDPRALTAAHRTALQEAGSPILRFRETSAGVQQLPGDAREVPLCSLDLTGEADPYAAAMAWMEADIATPFNLAAGPLCRVALLKVRSDRLLWYSAYHHLVMDFTGAWEIEKRAADLYEAAVGGRTIPPGELTPWTEVLRDELEYRDSDRLQRDRSYWRGRLRNRPGPVTLSGRPPAWPDAILSTRASVPGATMASLEELGTAGGAGLLAALFAAIALQLWRLTGERDLVLGMAADTRTNGRLRRATGCLSNIIPLRLTVDPAGSAAQLIRHCGVRIREALRHRRYWSSALRSDLGVAPNEPNIYGPMLNFLPEGAPFQVSGRPAPLTAFVHSAGVQDFSITVHARRDRADAAVQFDANAANYDRVALEAYARDFLTLLESLLEGPEAPVWQLPMISDRKRQRILGAGRGTDLPCGPHSVVELFEAHAQRAPQAPGAIGGEHCLSYGELDARATQLARRLIDAGVGRGRVVAVWADRSIEMVIGVLAVWKAGAAYLPLDPAQPAERLRMMLAEVRPFRMLRRSGHLSFDLADPVAGDAVPPAPADKHHDCACVIYNSGSGGAPQAVVVRHAGLSALAAAHAEHLEVRAQSRVLQLASLTSSVALAEMLLALTQGAALVLAPAEVLGGELRELLVRQRVTHALLRPSVLATLRRMRDLVLQALVVRGETCPPALIDEWSSGLRMINAYGQTESTVFATLSEPLRSGEGVSIGRPITGTRVYVLDASLEPVPAGVAGELCIGGVALAAGYLNRPALTAERFVADPHGPAGSRIYRSGDRARWREDGSLEYLGRAEAPARNGKLGSRAVAAPPERLAAPYEDPQTPTEVRLAAIWSEVLRAPRIGRSDDFFALGGHSLLALQLTARIRDAFHIELPLKTLFDQPTLQPLAARIEGMLADAPTQSLATVVPMQWSGPAPLSYSQARMWLIQSLNPAGTAYNMGAALWLRGDLDVAAVCDGFDELIARHEILRSRVQLLDGEPRQIVEPARPGMLRFTDLRSHGDAGSEALRRAQDDLRATFDLRSGPVFRAQLLQTGDRTFLFSLVLHHVAGDQWSMGLLGRELSELYNRRRRGDGRSLEPLPVSYRDFAQWDRSDGRASQIEGQLRFWRRELANLPTVDLPVDLPRPRLWTMNGSFHQRAIPPELFAAVGRLARDSGSTLFMTLFAGFAALLQRITGQSDLPIGVPVANRTLSVVEGLIGAFVNTVIIRADLRDDPAFSELLARARRATLDAFANQDVSFDRLVQELAQRGDRSHAPLAQVMFNVINAPMHGIELDGVSWEQAHLDRRGAQFELSFTVDTELTRNLIVEYNTDLFEHGTIERLVDQYLALLQSAAGAPETRISRLAMLPAAQQAALQRWNDTTAPVPPGTFPDLFAAQAARSADRVAISSNGNMMTYGELDARASALAGLLRGVGARRGKRVAVCVRRSPQLLVSLLAVQKSGAAYVPLDPDFPVERLKYMLADSGARVVLTSGPLPEASMLPEGVATIDLATAALVSGQEPTDGPKPADAAYVLYTSGSTGRPKGVTVPHGALINFLQSMRVTPGMTDSDAIAAVTTVSFDIAGLELYLPLLVGARIELVAREIASDGGSLAQLLHSAGITIMQATPATWRLLVDSGWRGTPRLKALCGGEALSRKLADEILDRVGELWNMYGPTETTIWSTLERIERGSRPINIGRPIANTRVHVLDGSGAVAPIGVVGEICIAGAGVAEGYHGLPALTAERFMADNHSEVPGSRLYRTGDLGRWGADGKLYHEGRRDHQVKLRGFRIELGEIEQALTSYPAIKHAVAAVRQAGPEDPRLVAHVVLADGEEVMVGEIRRYLRRLLPDYMIPSVIMPLLTLPLSPNGKLDRAALPDPFAASGREEATWKSPPSGLERQLAQIWMSVLKVERVGRADNFFELGGYSLLALRVAHQLERRTGRRLDPRALFFHDLGEVAEMLERDPAAGADAR